MNQPQNPGQRLKEKLRNGQPAFGLWITLEASAVIEIAVHLGLDWVCIDTEHGNLDFREVSGHLAAANRSATAALVRVQEIEQGVIKRVLDLGAHGVIVPQVCTAEEVEQAVRFAKYPPRGVRGVGAERSTFWGKALHRARTANQDTLVIPIIERVEAGKNIGTILSVPDVDAFFFGPADFSASAGFPGEWEGAGVAEEILRIKERIRAAGVPCGL
ncbi:MAG: aldolase/citrate lyase family protein, partial [Acidobacteria bacterium]|nr:aldolase/citrate lyase family protein [Acidobacteriota bacterium]